MLRTFREATAGFLEQRLNEHLKTMAQDTLAEKQTLATWVNEQLRAVGLAVKCPKTSLPGILKADFKDGANDSLSRFRVKVWDPRRGRYQSFSSNTLWDLTLVEAPPRRESLSRGFRRPGCEDRPR
ncbi:MAG TPA: hypothetical protein VFC39_10590 [Acidobacteriaceae bacterium]|nr:hypothetical protein [Acidobacteriaceae bacterium]